MPHIEVRNVSLVYDTPAGSVSAVDGVSFDMEQSQFLCLLGPSGCGKTTLLNIIAGFLAPTGGEIRIGGEAVRGQGTDRGIVFQDFAQLFPWRTALGNVAFGLEMKGVGKAEREEMALKQLRLVKLEKFAHSYPHHLSGGMQQRVAIARALAYEPEVLLMDEPFGSLDALTRLELEDSLLALWAELKTTIIFITHDIEEAIYLSSRIWVLSRRPSKIIDEIAIDFRRPRNQVTTRSEPRFMEIRNDIYRNIRN